MNDNRPVNLDIGTIKLPITSYVSFLHRASGVFIFVGFALLVWMLEASLASEACFNELKEYMTTPLAKFVIWSIVAGLIYHTVVGVKHLIMDMGIGETLEGGVLGAQISLVMSAILMAVVGYWIW